MIKSYLQIGKRSKAIFVYNSNKQILIYRLINVEVDEVN